MPEEWRSSSASRSKSVDTSEDSNKTGSKGGNGNSSNKNKKGSKAGVKSGKVTKAKKTNKKNSCGAKAAAAAAVAAAAAADKKHQHGVSKTRLESKLLRLREQRQAEAGDDSVIDASYLLESDKRLRKKNVFSSQFY